MAPQTIPVLLRHGRERVGTEIHHARGRPAPRFHVRAAGAMARLALQTAVAKRAVRIVRSRVLGTEQARDRGVVMATQAGVCPQGAVRRIRMRWRIGSRYSVGLRRGVRRGRGQDGTPHQSHYAGQAGTR